MPGRRGAGSGGEELRRYTYTATTPDRQHVHATTTRRFTHAVVVDKASYTGDLASQQGAGGWGLWAFVDGQEAAQRAVDQASRLYGQVEVVPVDNPRASIVNPDDDPPANQPARP